MPHVAISHSDSDRTPHMMNDSVSLHALALTASIGPDWWGRSRPQPVLLTLHVQTSLSRAGNSDNVSHTIHYGHLSKAVLALQAPEREFASLAELAQAAADVAMSAQLGAVDEVRVVAEAPKLLLQAQGLGIEIVRRRTPAGDLPPDKVYVKDLALPIIIGVNPPEREHKQLVITTVLFHNSRINGIFPHRVVVEQLTNHIESTAYLTLEAFVTSVARVACHFEGMDTVTVRAQKPSAVSFGHSSGVEVTRTRAFFET